jgi:RNA polymerase sigma-70 factor, ECF subfamily
VSSGAERRQAPAASSATHLDAFTAHRSAAFGAAYRVLGSVSDADDVVQECWLRWSRVDLDGVRDPKSYLITTATRLALDRVREVQRRRESYVGPWLPEPLPDRPTDPAELAELADSMSMAMLVVLSSLTPLERAAFVLRDVFDLPYADVAATLGRTEAATRQLTHRARSHVQARAPRVRVDPHTHEEVLRRFIAALEGGSISELLELLAPNAVLITDGGGKRKAALRPIVGAEKILRWLAGVASDESARGEARLIMLNGEPATAFVVDGEIDGVGMVRIEDERVTELYFIRNPDKLAGLRTPG